MLLIKLYGILFFIWIIGAFYDSKEMLASNPDFLADTKSKSRKYLLAFAICFLVWPADIFRKVSNFTFRNFGEQICSFFRYIDEEFEKAEEIRKKHKRRFDEK